MLVVAKSNRDPAWIFRKQRALRPAPVCEAVEKMSTLERRELERLLSQQRGFTGQIRAAFLRAIDQIQSQLDANELARLLQNGLTGQAINYVNAQLTAQNFRPLTTAVTRSILQAGHTAARTASVPREVRFTFGTVNPGTIQRLQQNEMRLIREISETARQNVASVIREGVSAGRNPLNIASDVREHIGLTQRQSQAVRNYRRQLEEGDSGALDRALRPAQYDDVVQSAVDGETALSQKQIDRFVAQYEQRYLGYRAETIARTEAIRANNEGNTEAWRQAASEGTIKPDRVTRHWIFTDDDRVREAHAEIPDMNPDGVGLDEPFDTPLGPLYYPGDPGGEPDNVINCRCSVFIRYTPG